MYKFLSTRGQTLALILGLVVIAIFLGSVFSGLSSSGYDMSTDLNKLPDEAKNAIGFFNPGLGLTALLVAIAAGATILFGIVGIAKFPKSSMKMIIVVVLLFILFFLFYSMSGTEFGADSKMTELIGKYDLSDGVVKFIGGGINVTMLLTIGAVIIWFVLEIKNLFN